MPKRPASPSEGCAWVTGASSGLGLAITRALALNGWRVAASARSAEKLDHLAAETPGQVFSVPVDVTDRAAMRTTATRVRAGLGPIGLLVACAGYYEPMDARRFDAEIMRRVVEVNLMGAAHALENVLPEMVERRAGCVHLVSSATAFGGMPSAAAYGATKAALVNLAESLKIELDRVNIGVSVSTPGFIDTPMQADTAFPKPFIVTANEGANRIVAGLLRGDFEITFPKRFTWALKAAYALPRSWRLPLIRNATGWGRQTEPPPLLKNDPSSAGPA